jgi:SagB-type dehydrogenase family enzyme
MQEAQWKVILRFSPEVNFSDSQIRVARGESFPLDVPPLLQMSLKGLLSPEGWTSSVDTHARLQTFLRHSQVMELVEQELMIDGKRGACLQQSSRLLSLSSPHTRPARLSMHTRIQRFPDGIELRSCEVDHVLRVYAGPLLTQTLLLLQGEQLEGPWATVLCELGFAKDNEESPNTAWDLSDKVFHYSSQLHRKQSGAVYPFRQGAQPITPPQAGLRLSHAADSSPFKNVSRRRTTTRLFSDSKPVSLEQVNHWLSLSLSEEAQHRPYPSGGGLQSLNFWVVVRSVTGISPGCYRYDPVEHSLGLHSTTQSLRESYLVSRGEHHQALSLIITGNYHRMAEKYRDISYRVLLLEAGCALQSLYLSAAEVGLGLRPWGGLPARWIERELLGLPSQELALLDLEVGALP